MGSTKNRMSDLKRIRGVADTFRQSFSRRSSRGSLRNTELGRILNISNGITNELKNLSQHRDDLKKCYDDLLVATSNDEKLRLKLTLLKSDIKTTELLIRNQLLKLDPTKTDFSTHKRPELQIISAQYTNLHGNLCRTTTDIHLCEAEYQSRLRRRIQREISIAGQEVSDEAVDALMQDGYTGAVFTQDIITTIEEAKANLAEINNREAELQKLETKIVEVSELFRLLASQVEDQGQVINNIEWNIIRTEDHIMKGAKNLNTAFKMKKNRRKTLFVVAGIVLTVIIVSGIIIAVLLA